MHTSPTTGDRPASRIRDRFPTRPRWDGKLPAFSAHRVRAMAQLRDWEKAKKAGAAPDPEACMGGTELLAYAAASKAYPFPVRRPAGNELGDLVLRDRHITALAWVLAVQRGFGRDALLITHADMAILLGCSERTAGTTMRYLAGLGLVTALPMFVAGGCGHAQLACAYRVSELALKLFRIRHGAAIGGGKNCQPSETPGGDPRKVVSAVADVSIVETEPTEDLSHGSERVKARHAAPRRSNERAVSSADLGAPQVVRMLERQQAEHMRRIKRALVTAIAREAPYSRSAAAPPTTERDEPGPVLAFGDLHPDDAAWLASRSPGAGAAPKRTPADEDRELAEAIAAANASFDRLTGGGES